jgi:hypothetical protein
MVRLIRGAPSFFLRRLGHSQIRAIVAAVMARQEFHRSWMVAVNAFAALTLAGCDPIVNIAGANFPAWMLCAIVGAIATAGAQAVFKAVGVEPHLGPRVIIYPCFAILIGCTFYLVFFNRI